MTGQPTPVCVFVCFGLFLTDSDNLNSFLMELFILVKESWMEMNQMMFHKKYNLQEAQEKFKIGLSTCYNSVVFFQGDKTTEVAKKLGWYRNAWELFISLFIACPCKNTSF